MIVSVTPATYVDAMGVRTRTHGRPGSTPRLLARRRRLAAIGVVVVGAIGAALLLVAGLAATGLAVIVVAWFARRSLLAGSSRALAGARAEQLVAGAVRRVRAHAVVFNARLPGRRGDVDVVLLGPMVAAVEVKRGTGRVRWSPDGRVRVGGRLLPGRPLGQVVAQAAALRRALDGVDHVEAVLCVTGMRQRPRLAVVNDVEVWVTSARHLRRVAHRMPRRVGRQEAERMASSLG